MTGSGRDVERTDLDVRVEAEDRAGRPPAVVEGADVIAHREVLERFARVNAGVAPGFAHAGSLQSSALDVLVEAHDRMAGDEWDPLAYLGSVASGIVRALRDLGAVVIVRTPEVPERRVSSVILCGNLDGRRCTCGAPADTPNGMHHTYCPVNPASRTGGGS